MRVDLDKNYCIVSEEYNFHLCKRAVGKSGKSAGQERLDIIAYTSRLEHALEAYVQKAGKTANTTTVPELLKALAEINANVTRASREFMVAFPPRLAQPTAQKGPQ